MFKKAILHIGATKTGTSAIQSALSVNRAALAEHGILYPAGLKDEKAASGRVTAGNGDFLDRLHRRHGTGELKSGAIDGYIKSLATDRTAHTLLFSSEVLGSFGKEFVGLLKTSLEKYVEEVRVIYYVRHVADHALSQHGEYVKRRGRSVDFREFSRGYKCRFADTARIYSDIFGRDALSVVLYDDVRAAVFENFVATAGLPAIDWKKPGRVNRSLSEAELRLFMQLNELPNNQAFLARTVENFTFTNPPFGDGPTVTRADIEAIGRKNAEVIAYINANFALSSPLALASDRIPIGKPRDIPPDPALLAAVLKSALFVSAEQASKAYREEQRRTAKALKARGLEEKRKTQGGFLRKRKKRLGRLLHSAASFLRLPGAAKTKRAP